MFRKVFFIGCLRVFQQALVDFMPTSRVGKIMFLILFFAGAFLRLAGVTWGIPTIENQSSIYHDEGHVLGSVLWTRDQLRKNFGEYEIVRPIIFWRVLGRPLIFLGDNLGINDASTRIFELGAMRVVTAIVAIIGLLAVYALGRKLGSDATGLWAMALLVFIPGHWYYAQILKGDILVATFFPLILLYAIRIAEKGSLSSYIMAGAIYGAGVAIKATTIIAGPIILLAHLLYVFKTKQWRKVAGKQAWAALLTTMVAFLALYPYPFMDFQRLRELLSNPSSQSFEPTFYALPSTYVTVWQQYNEPLRPYGEMVFGKFLQPVLMPLFFMMIAVSVVQFARTKRSDLLLVVALAVLFVHSLTFTAVLDERYLVPAAPLAVLFVSCVITGVGLPRSRAFQYGRTLAGILLLVGTAAVTWVTFPSFALDNPREQAMAWVNSTAAPGSMIAQPSQLSRWALRFNRDIYRVQNFVYGPDEARHVARLLRPDYLLIQRDPWNFDHSFRYELKGVDAELGPFLGQFQQRQTFGKVPTVFGWRVPQNLGTPIIDVYSHLQPQFTERPILPSLGNYSMPFRHKSMALILQRESVMLAGTYVKFDLKPRVELPKQIDGSVLLGLALQPTMSLPMMSEIIQESAVRRVGLGQVLFIPLPVEQLAAGKEVRVAVDFLPDGQVAFYAGSGEQLNFIGYGPYAERMSSLSVFILNEDMAASIGRLDLLNVVQGSYDI
ncbi:MAG: glycosyltransferase family 39 protein [Candidatus Andersenbacteria bacterium]|nr:glycosyltransferase family 39 protein [Candidatus Andersenbacteria bacterium]